jgi:hypothetical protein
MTRIPPGRVDEPPRINRHGKKDNGDETISTVKHGTTAALVVIMLIFPV